jgi:aminopeptidase S
MGVFVLTTTLGLLTRSGIRLALVAILVALGATACGSGAVDAPTAPDGPLVRQLTGSVSDARTMKHLQALQKIADQHGGNRAAGTAGYDASVEYVVDVLRDIGFEASTPAFESSDEGDEDTSLPQRNVITQTISGDPDQIVMIGAHLDSVEDGPGIVDNGSGVATLLEIATQLGADPPVQNMVRFAFFGDEESGAEGSSAYVEDLSDADRKKIKLYLNVDMVASPNGGYFAQGGDPGESSGWRRFLPGEESDPEAVGPPGSATIGRVLADQLAKTGVKDPEIIEFVGDDESPFIEADIPVGGAESGDDEEKTAKQARLWGGTAGEPYDSCYHEACDTIDNVNREMLDHYMRAIAGTLAHFATSTEQLR